MSQHEFVLVFQLPNKEQDPRIHADALAKVNGQPCFGLRGYIAMECRRVGQSLWHAKRDAIRDVLEVIPDAKLDEMLMAD